VTQRNRFIVAGLVGVVVTIGTAWAFAAWSGGNILGGGDVVITDRWPATVPQDWPLPTVRVASAWGLSLWRGSGGAPASTSTSWVTQQEVFQAGWPFRALHAERHWVESARANDRWAMSQSQLQLMQPPGWSSALHIPGALRGEWGRVWPIRPFVWGFLADWLLYGAVAYAALVAPTMLRRFHRIRHRLCAVCGYPVGVSERCTECGAKVTPHRLAESG
jgi:hypothetical protein